jgi:putative transcriptional regulator
VLNRPTEAPVAEFLPGWSDHLADPPVVFVGGPVSPETAVGLARLQDPGSFEGWTPVAESVGLLDLSLPTGSIPVPIESLRVFSGYAGWGPGQLQTEIDDEGWFIVATEDHDPFRPDAVDLWRTALRRQSSRLRLYADFPPHPSYN